MNTRDIKFKCPSCGGSAFGSVQNPDGSLARSCHANGAGDSRRSHCSFQFHMKDDWKHFTVYGKHVSQAEYEAAFKQLRDELSQMTVQGFIRPEQA